ncbi:TIGR00282 family metallophosphoesterase [Coraliomargarita sp. SDUM461004]|uniref:TIGR00282 family metallophosphoesterase n=1 Tax=Thalassobacterium sedimentorum TaxID=3041258 RepID=A0ABU1ADR0_9BACT|nr:TIGR00282 family metallophosphoesterase [Coraliomargarita sp. SDUM461004]MDQ8192849.1 TIGR00282 family metallophosphoesterase [Coraliomargarita sp. SDUM461004]
MPKILFLGDIVGRPGRHFVMERVAALRAELDADFVIANAENSAGGAGITKKIADGLIAAGVDAITLGDHVWDQKNFENEIDQLAAVCRPANLPEQNPGRTHVIVERNGFRLAVFTLLGRNYLALKSSCPFRMADLKLTELKSQCDAVFVEAHMEATSEKIALGWHLDGRASAVVGTHTHVPTADGRVLPQGTAYLTDAGMCGPYASVLGRDVSQVLATFKDGMKRRFPVAEGDVRIAGCLIEVDADSGLSLSFQRVELAK